VHEYAFGKARYSADPGDFDAQSDLIGVPGPVSIGVVLAAPIGSTRAAAARCLAMLCDQR